MNSSLSYAIQHSLLTLIGLALMIASMMPAEGDGPRITETPLQASKWEEEFHRPGLWMATSSVGPIPPGRIEKVGTREHVVTDVIIDPYGRRQPVPRKTGKLYDVVAKLYTRDGGQLAYTARQGDDWYMVFEDREWGPYTSEPSQPQFSPNGKRIAYVVERQAIIDGQPSAQGIFRFDLQFIFSPDSLHVAYPVHDGRTMHYIIDGKEQPSYEQIGGFTFSPDNQHFAYLTETDNTTCIVHDGQKETQYASLQPDTVKKARTGIAQFSALLFSENGSSLVYGTVDNNQGIVVFNGKEIARDNKTVEQIEISADGRKVAYRFKGNPYIYTNDGRKYQCPPGYRNDSLTFSPDGTYLLFVANANNGQSIFVNGKPGRSYAKIRRLYNEQNATTGYLTFHAQNAFHYFVQKDATRYEELVVEETLPGREGNTATMDDSHGPLAIQRQTDSTAVKDGTAQRGAGVE